MVNYNDCTYTLESLRSLVNSSYENYEVLLIDNASSEVVRQKIKDFCEGEELITVSWQAQNLGYVGGINVGMNLAQSMNADYLLVMNNDTLIDGSAIKNLVECGERHDHKAIISGKVYNYDEKDTLQYIGQEFDPKGMLDQVSIVKNRREKDIGQYDSEREMGMLDDIYWLVPINVQREVGYYSDYFFLYGEQNDYAFRAIKSGYKLIYTPKAKLWHKGGATTCNGNKKSAKVQYWSTFAVLKLAVLHFPESRSKPFIRNWYYKQLLKAVIHYFMGKNKKENVKAVYLAHKHFKLWNVVRYKDNGFNPFN